MLFPQSIWWISQSQQRQTPAIEGTGNQEDVDPRPKKGYCWFSSSKLAFQFKYCNKIFCHIQEIYISSICRREDQETANIRLALHFMWHESWYLQYDIGVFHEALKWSRQGKQERNSRQEQVPTQVAPLLCRSGQLKKKKPKQSNETKFCALDKLKLFYEMKIS